MNPDLLNPVQNRMLSPTNLPIINENCSEVDDQNESNNKKQNFFYSNSSMSNNAKIVKQKNLKDNTSNKDNLSMNCSKSIDIFFHKNEIFNENVNQNWQQLSIFTFVPKNKLLSINSKEIIFKGILNKLILSHLKQNCSTNVEKFCLLTKESFSIYKSKESCLLMQKPQHYFFLKNIIGCRRIDLSALNILKLQGLFFFYIEMKTNDMPNMSEEKNHIDHYANDEEMIREILKKEKEEQFFVLFSYNELLVDQWVCLTNYFLNNKILND